MRLSAVLFFLEYYCFVGLSGRLSMRVALIVQGSNTQQPKRIQDIYNAAVQPVTGGTTTNALPPQLHSQTHPLYK